MVVVIIENSVTDRSAYLPLAIRFTAETRCDAGCLGCDLLIPEDDTEHVVFISRWEKKSDFESHCLGSTFSRHIPGMSKYFIDGTTKFYNIP